MNRHNVNNIKLVELRVEKNFVIRYSLLNKNVRTNRCEKDTHMYNTHKIRCALNLTKLTVNLRVLSCSNL